MVGRPEKPLDPRDPVQAFAQRLRDLRQTSGGPYAELASRSHYSAATLSEAARGTTLPTWEVTVAYVQACGGDPEQWRSSWEQAKDTVTDPAAQSISRTGLPSAAQADELAGVGSAPSAPVADPAPGKSPAAWERGPARLIAAGAVVVLLVVISVTLARATQRDPLVTSIGAPPVPSATVVQPAQGKVVENATYIPARGELNGLPASHTLFCFVVNDEDRWYPYPVRVMGGLWESSVGVGPESPKAELVFTIHIVAATSEATTEIQDIVKQNTPEWAGLDDLPAGATSLASVNIVRTP